VTARRVTDLPDVVGLIRLDQGWHQRLESVLPHLGLRLAHVNGLDPARDGAFNVSRVLSVNAHVLPGPHYTVNAGSAVGLIDLACLLHGIDQHPAAVRCRFSDYTGDAALPRFDIRRQPDLVETIAKSFVYGLSFLVLHEQSHYTEGHLLFRKTHLGAAEEFLEATAGEALTPDQALTYRALEIDADVHASTTQLYAALAPSDREPMTREWVLESCTDLIDSFFGAAAAMALLSFRDRQLNRAPEFRKHPSGPMRTMMLFRTLGVLLEECGLQPEEIDELEAEALGALRRIYIALGLQEELALAVAAAAGQLPGSHPVQDERRTLALRLKAIRPNLDGCAAEVEKLLGINPAG